MKYAIVMDGERGITLATAEKLCRAVGLDLVRSARRMD